MEELTKNMKKSNKSKKPTDPNPPYGEDPEPQCDPEGEGENVKLHGDYVKRRLEGGAPATPHAYARAMAQWQRLPGAIPSLAATDLKQAQEAPTADEVTTPEPASDMQDKEQKS